MHYELRHCGRLVARDENPHAIRNTILQHRARHVLLGDVELNDHDLKEKLESETLAKHEKHLVTHAPGAKCDTCFRFSPGVHPEQVLFTLDSDAATHVWEVREVLDDGTSIVVLEHVGLGELAALPETEYDRQCHAAWRARNPELARRLEEARAVIADVVAPRCFACTAPSTRVEAEYRYACDAHGGKTAREFAHAPKLREATLLLCQRGERPAWLNAEQASALMQQAL
jgi:hypothetical protein